MESGNRAKRVVKYLCIIEYNLCEYLIILMLIIITKP